MTVEERLALAERVCLLYGWSGSTRPTSPRGKATLTAWKEWAAAVEPGFTDADAHPELDDAEIERLAGRFDYPARSPEGGATDGDA